MFRTLMTARRFAPLFWCQFLSAFNDNFVRQMLAMLILFRFGAEDAGAKISLAVAIFVLPSIPLSAIGGEIADAHDKAWFARRLKFAEIGVQLIAAAGFVPGSLNLLYLALFGLGCISALFGPVKYGILPDHLHRDELIAGNALVEGATFAAIICGLVVGGYAAAEGRSAISVVVQLVSSRSPATPRRATSRATGVGAPNCASTTTRSPPRRILSELKADDRPGSALSRSAGSGWRRDHAVARSRHHEIAHRRRRRSRDRHQPVLRDRHRGRLVDRRGARAWPHRARADALHAVVMGADRHPSRP